MCSKQCIPYCTAILGVVLCLTTCFSQVYANEKRVVLSGQGNGLDAADKTAVDSQQVTRKDKNDQEKMSTQQAGRTFSVQIKPDMKMQFAYIKPGSFLMGSPDNEKERNEYEKQHRVTLTKGFFMQTTEVTQGQWKAVMGNNPSNFKNCGDDCPVEKVSWSDAQKFIQKLSKGSRNKYRLPTEAEWEYAARAGTKTPFFDGDCLSSDHANYNGIRSIPGCTMGQYREKTTAAAGFKPNAWGLYDMHGNVWEWCQDKHGAYPSEHVTDPQGPSSSANRVVRGGSWYSSAGECRSAFRGRDVPGRRSKGIGFRLVLLPDPKKNQAEMN